MKHALAAVLLLGLTGCYATEPNWRNVWPVTVQDWKLPPDSYEHQVSKPLPYDELEDYVDNLLRDGWEIESTHSAGPEFPACYLVVARKFR
jgi:hypothetical protein